MTELEPFLSSVCRHIDRLCQQMPYAETRDYAVLAADHLRRATLTAVPLTRAEHAAQAAALIAIMACAREVPGELSDGA